MSTDQTPAIPAASVILVRDAPELQVLMGERPLTAKAFPGALVFPGGKVEAQDADPVWRDRVAPLEGDDLLALRIAAIRETFEETGVLLAHAAPGYTPDVAPRDLAIARENVASGETDFSVVLDELGLWPDVAALTPFARWVTPLEQRYRFDTWFFIAVASDACAEPVATPEFASLDWAGVQAMTEAARLGGRSLLFPTRANLGLLAESLTAEQAVVAARARTILPVRPQAEVRDGRTVMTIRADAGYGVIQDPRTAVR